MLRKTCLLACLLVALPLASAADIELELSTESGEDEFVTRGSVKIGVVVENPEDEDVSGVRLEVGPVDGLTFSSGSASVAGQSSEKIELTVKGMVWEKKRISITASGDHPNMSVGSGTLGVSVVPPELDLEIISPTRELVMVDIPQGSEVDFTAGVKNTGEMELEDVALTLDPGKGVSCSVGGGKKDIGVGKTATWQVSCDNFTGGQEITLVAEDKREIARDSEVVKFKITESVKAMGLEILAPLENQEFRLGEFGGEIDVEVENTGEGDLEQVCVDVEGISFTGGGCADIPAGGIQSYAIEVIPSEETTIARIRAEDSAQQASDEVGVRILKIGAVVPVENETQEPPAQPPQPEENLTPPPNETEEKEEGGGTIFGIPQDVFTIIAVAIPIILLVAYIKIGLSRAEEY